MFTLQLQFANSRIGLVGFLGLAEAHSGSQEQQNSDERIRESMFVGLRRDHCKLSCFSLIALRYYRRYGAVFATRKIKEFLLDLTTV
jgi:hypothetical protein